MNILMNMKKMKEQRMVIDTTKKMKNVKDYKQKKAEQSFFNIEI